MNAMLLTVALVLSGADSLSLTKVKGLELKAPSSWASTDVEDGRNWEEPGKSAQLELSVFKVAPRRNPQECLNQLLEKLGKDGWDTVNVGGSPAVRKVTNDYVGDADAGKTEANKVSTVMYVGCNGATKWVMSMTSAAPKAGRFGAVLKAVVTSIAYEK
jgi:hypothetical protein